MSDWKRYSGTKSLSGPHAYLPSDELVEAVNLALLLKRPLLLRGEPGCGKTRLAGAVATELEWSSFCWSVKSTTTINEGGSRYDALGRLRDAQLAAADPEAATRAREIDNYLEDGVLAQAFRSPVPAVLLIDEIDKADLDFPNDLLELLDEQRIRIPETGEELTPQHPPLMIITSNDEKDLPDAFLRRCLFHYIEFPDDARLRRIVDAHFDASPDDLVSAAVSRFVALRATMKGDAGRGVKPPSTSELLDWFCGPAPRRRRLGAAPG